MNSSPPSRIIVYARMRFLRGGGIIGNVKAERRENIAAGENENRLRNEHKRLTSELISSTLAAIISTLKVLSSLNEEMRERVVFTSITYVRSYVHVHVCWFTLRVAHDL